ncbi:response regulator transcription factor [Streptomyces sp. WAC06614]|uniref:response regulator transcription factor n=1 Tax=Streptomyces sp. WAC06614 TaxID=2487416 RepID=UPI000F796526|nr:response regulator transcription factor [Streptomyces sp. WAC06614]RSS53639.1 DNA-binding response regulator [Streptomyces sp. WAC06614]
MTHVLIIEPDASVRVRLQRELGDLAYRVTTAGCGQDGLSAARRQRPDLVLLDLDVQDIDGFDALRKLCAPGSPPVIAAAPVHDERRAVAALRAGADDCVSKPFNLAMLGARLDVAARRSRLERKRPVLRIGDLTIDPAAHEAHLGGRHLRLRPREFELLCYLATREGRIISKHELQREIWHTTLGPARTVDVHLSMLRRRLGESATQPRYLHTFRGVGVKLRAPSP